MRKKNIKKLNKIDYDIIYKLEKIKLNIDNYTNEEYLEWLNKDSKIEELKNNIEDRNKYYKNKIRYLIYSLIIFLSFCALLSLLSIFL